MLAYKMTLDIMAVKKDLEAQFKEFCEEDSLENGCEVTEINGYTLEDMGGLARNYIEVLEQDYYYFGKFTYDPETWLTDELY